MNSAKERSQSISKGVKSSSLDSELTDGQRILLYALIVGSALGIFVTEFFTELGVAVWVFYVIPVTASLAMWRPYHPPLLAGIVSVLIMIGFLVSPEGGEAARAQLNRSFGILTLWLMAGVGYFYIRNRIQVHRQTWLQQGRTTLSSLMTGDLRPQMLCERILQFYAKSLDASSGVLYLQDEGRLQLVSKYGIPVSANVPATVEPGDGLTGRAIVDRQPMTITNVPDSFQWIGVAHGTGKPESLFIAPIALDESIEAVVELAFLGKVDDTAPALLDATSEAVGMSIRSSKYRDSLQNLLEETQRQAEELQVQSEELRVSNEELEEQGRALRESQARLEQQQVELEQTNVQLEEQAQQLEVQRDEIVRAQSETEAKAAELERASRYKSEFLANMSHELRTPLNSSLILARLLADNPKGNLTPEQVKSALTILSSGNDLLVLINDILDLSKIEAGRMEIRVQTVRTSQVLEDLAASMRPLAEQKGLRLEVEFSPNFPATILSDQQRLEQILKNLLSNAIKFTDEGEVRMRIRPVGSDRVAFDVSDTGIGIDKSQQEAIFEAFRQVDSAANRKYSGTGLGLSISRELARLLGGEIELKSGVGKGSTFTALLPLVTQTPVKSDESAPEMPGFDVPFRHLPKQTAPVNLPSSTVKSVSTENAKAAVHDDRGELVPGRRTILVVEDDERFARVLYELAKEDNFQCLIGTTASEALSLAIECLPSAIVLDIGLPDQSGLSVLDQLKMDSRTRHIPVHVISGSDYRETALSMGAIGYFRKPVTRETLINAMRDLESRLTQRMRRVLLVEDDPVQLDSMSQLLGSHDVATIGVGSAAECLDKLRQETFDCMVLDLSLPDASGYSLLETLSKEDAYSFPPVIVYTGRDLSSDEEHKLRKYSKSIIIKGAKSPERLLDEVMLFLHQVVADLPPEQQKMIQKAKSREDALEGKRILIVEDDVRNVFALTSILEPRGVVVQIARNGREALTLLEAAVQSKSKGVDLILMDVMMPEMDGLTATREIRKRPEMKNLPIIVLTAKAMIEDQENCLAAGANDYLSKPLDVDKLLSLIRVWVRK